MKKISSHWINVDEYLKYLDDFSSTQTSMYHNPLWLNSITRGFSCELKFVRTMSKNSTLALTPFMTQKKGPISLIGSPLRGMYTEFLGTLFKNDLNIDDINNILKSQHDLISPNMHYIEWAIKESNKTEILLNKYENLGYEYFQKPSLLIDLSIGKEALWSSFKGRARNMIRKGEKAEIYAKAVNPSQEWLSEYYKLLEETFSRQGLSPPHPFSFYKEIENLSNQGFVLCFEVVLEKKLVSAAIFLIDKKRMMYFSGVSNSIGMKLAASSLIQWKAMQNAIDIELIDYDMGGLGVDSIDKFKRSFGGKDIYHSKWLYRSKTFKILEPIALWLSRKGLI
tara:strand:+ start:241 stop:1254 length:1014 start_codon:yes stop_codon:yes gene_type:complete